MKKIMILLLFILSTLTIGFYLINNGTAKKYVTAKNYVTQEDSSLKGKTIVIDPGHGGNDRGTKGRKFGTIEKNLNLKVAKNIEKELKERTSAKVILTRQDDNSLLSETKQKQELQARVNVAKDHSADLYISIHHDAFEDTNIQGITTHYGTNKHTDQNLAQAVQDAIFKKGIDTRDRGVRGSDYLVLRENTVPAILIELGFTSNESDEKRMNSTDFQVKTQQGIVDGIINYFTS